MSCKNSIGQPIGQPSVAAAFTEPFCRTLWRPPSFPRPRLVCEVFYICIYIYIYCFLRISNRRISWLGRRLRRALLQDPLAPALIPTASSSNIRARTARRSRRLRRALSQDPFGACPHSQGYIYIYTHAHMVICTPPTAKLIKADMQFLCFKAWATVSFCHPCKIYNVYTHGAKAAARHVSTVSRTGFPSRPREVILYRSCKR